MGRRDGRRRGAAREREHTLACPCPHPRSLERVGGHPSASPPLPVLSRAGMARPPTTTGASADQVADAAPTAAPAAAPARPAFTAREGQESSPPPIAIDGGRGGGGSVCGGNARAHTRQEGAAAEQEREWGGGREVGGRRPLSTVRLLSPPPRHAPEPGARGPHTNTQSALSLPCIARTPSPSLPDPERGAARARATGEEERARRIGHVLLSLPPSENTPTNGAANGACLACTSRCFG